MTMSIHLHNLASVSTGTARAVYESACSAFQTIFEGTEDTANKEEQELAELSELGNEIGDSLDGSTEGNDESDNQVQGNSDSIPEENPSEPEQQPTNEVAPEPAPENVNAQPQPASISAGALIEELKKLKYPEKIREVGQQMKQSAKGETPDAEDMIKPVAAAISKYMTKKGYAAMQKEDALRVVKTIIMAATDVGKDTPHPGQ